MPTGPDTSQSPAARGSGHLSFTERQAATDAAPRPILSVGVLGAGTMGSGIAISLAMAEFDVVLVDTNAAALAAGMERLRSTLDATVAKGRIDRHIADAALGRVRSHGELESLAEMDLVIEAVFENLAVKREVFGHLGKICGPDAILASNTSTLDIDAIAESSGRPAAVVGMHFFSPANVMRLVEIVRGSNTPPDVIATVMAVTQRMGKLGIVVGNCFGFVGNRMLYAYGRENQLLLLEGATPTQVDAAMESFGMAMGPNAVGDLAGLDVGYRVRRERQGLRDDPRYYRVADLLVESGRLGQKTGGGAFTYAPGSRKPIREPAVEALIEAESRRLGIERRVIGDEEIQRRCLYALINEGAQILAEGIATSSSDIDAIWCNGYGFPRARGGPLFYADTVGPSTVLAGINELAAVHGKRYWTASPRLVEIAATGGTFGIFGTGGQSVPQRSEAMNLESYVGGSWQAGREPGVALRDATTGDVIAEASAAGIDFAKVLSHARAAGGPALRQLTFHERAALLKALGKYLTERKDEFYELSYRSGATKGDSWIDIDGGIGTLFGFASKATRELPNSRVYLDGAVEGLSKGGTFVAQHIYVSREGAAVQINAFNFPVWGMLEKLAPSLLAGMPAIVKPATTTAYLTELVVRRIVESRILPEGSLQLICGSVGDLFDHLTCQDSVAFTGSADTAARLRVHPAIVRNAVPFIAETDSLNSCILAADAAPGTPEFDLFVKEVAREITVKAGQKCTAIRRAFVPRAAAGDVVAALQAILRKVVVGDPRAEGVRMGPLVSTQQRSDVVARVAELRQEADIVSGNMNEFEVRNADRQRGAFLPPLLLLCRDGHAARAVHEVEAFGPVATVVPYNDTDDAIALARRGQGSLVASVFCADDALASRIVWGLAPYHGRVLVVDRTCAKESTGHGSPLPSLIHGGPGRAGGGEEMGGIRGVLHYMQRSAVQGSPDAITAVGGRWVRGSRLRDPGVHPFRIAFHELVLGDTFQSGEREVTVEDIERFAALSGDTFYAHMSEKDAARNPLFGGRVAHGYFLISAAAGLFVEPAYGPVLGNYGLDNLRFVKPVKPLDRIKVRLSCAHKSLRAEKGWGEVGWDTEITNQLGETVASYTVLTMVSIHAVPDVVPGAVQ